MSTAAAGPVRVSAVRRGGASFWGGLSLGLGGLGVILTCVFYKLSPPAAAMPVLPPDPAAARAGALAGAATMRLAGLAGVPGDLLTTAGAFLLAGAWLLRGRGAGALGLLLVGLSTIVFTVVDSMVGFVLAPAAAEGGGFVAIKSLFDILFVVGTACFGLGALLFGLAETLDQPAPTPRPLALAAALAGAAAFAAGAGELLGLDLHTPLGLSILAGSISFAAIGATLARRPD